MVEEDEEEEEEEEREKERKSKSIDSLIPKRSVLNETKLRGFKETLSEACVREALDGLWRICGVGILLEFEWLRRSAIGEPESFQ